MSTSSGPLARVQRVIDASVGTSSLQAADYLRAFKVIIAIKYAAVAIEPLQAFFRVGAERGYVFLLTTPPPLFWISRFAAIPVVVGAVLWLVRRRPGYGMFTMFAILFDAITKMSDQGFYFFNHYFLQAVIAILGMFALARQRNGDSERHAWSPIAYLGVVVWTLAGLKKLLHGTYLNGEYIASVGGQERRSLLYRISRSLLAPGGVPTVPENCCVTSDVDVPTFAGVAVVVIGIGIILAELSPIVVLTLTRKREVVAWLTLALSVVATVLADEMDFGMLLVALTLLLGEGRRFRQVAILTALVMGGVFLWEKL